MPASDGSPAERLTELGATELAASLREAWEVMPPASAAEIAILVQAIVPYQGPDIGFVSTTSAEAFGTIALSRQPDRYTCAETLVHEAQHLKLSAVLDLARLTIPDDGRRYYAPWRADPRPASGLLQGAYAFLGVSGFWRWQRRAVADPALTRRAEARFARWRESAATAVGTLLASGQLTAVGMDFAWEMARVLAGWRAEPVPAEALVVAGDEAASHLARWRAANGETTPRQVPVA
jgi:uncharacterized protein